MSHLPALPIHPTKRHPLTGQPLQAVWVRPDGRVMWPMIGAAPDDGAGAGDAGAGGDGGDASAGSGGDAGTGSSASGSGSSSEDLGFPKDTPLTEMNVEQREAYWKHQARKHEGLWKGIAGGRKPDEVKADLDAYAEVQRAQQTPAEQALTDAREQGRREAVTESNTKAATAILRAQLSGAQIEDSDIETLLEPLDMRKFITDDDVDIAKITDFAKRFTPAGTAPRERDFGAGRRPESGGRGTSAGKAEAQRRFANKQQTTTGS